MKLILFILFNIYIIVKLIDQKNIAKNIEIGKNEDIINDRTRIKIKSGGNYTIKGKYNDLTIRIKSSNVIVNLFNGKYNSISKPIFLIEQSLDNITINIIKSSFKCYKFIEIKKYSNIKIYIKFSKIQSYNNIIEVENKSNIIIKGSIKFNINLQDLNQTLVKLNNSLTYLNQTFIHLMKNLNNLKINLDVLNKYITNFDKNAKYLNELLRINNQKYKIINKNILSKDININCEKKEINIDNLYIKFIPKPNKTNQYFQYFNNNKSSNINKCRIRQNERIILTMTSWTKRINDCHKVIERLLQNTLKPYKLILNLAIEEFPKQEKELPISLLNLTTKYTNFRIHWVLKNNNVFKKLIPTINKYKNDIIITVDDDVNYPKSLIKNMMKEFRRIGSNKPMSFGGKKSNWKVNKFKRISSHYGACSIVKYKFFNERLNELYYNATVSELEKGIKCFDDFLYTYAALLNGYKYKRANRYSCRKFVTHTRGFKFGFSDILYKKKKWDIYKGILKKYIWKKYHVTFKDLVKKRKMHLWYRK